MNKKLMLFLKSFSLYNTLLKILILFFLGLFIRIFINELLNSNSFYKLFILFSSLLFNEELLNMNIVNNKIIDYKHKWLINDYNDRWKRKIQWSLFHKFKGKFKSYEDFKEQWDADTKLIEKIKDKYKEKKQEIILMKKTLLWFINRKG